ncbi:hypothetical protein [Pedobacter boryungensis]|uniref:Uncharacterized protein n=1 Tax=Pedobacter boryungensis TaxID=869962 RepID=A0ABX2DG31_9SPHI|nr:hypothetical protein [Pedobacter boryungensis]NQX32438.1 hypothetical protein [Pedobacter boryungensis]
MIKNKNPYIVSMAIFMLSIGIYSCRKEMPNIPEMKPEAQWAKSYFNDVLLPKAGNQVSYRVANKLSSIKERERKPNQKTPLWTRASLGKTALYEFVEVPLSYNRKIVTLFGPKDMKIDPEIIKASFNRLIIFKDKKGKIDQRIVSFIPDKDYLQRHNGDISHNKIDHLDSDFNGFLVYKTWDDVTVSRLRIINGKAISLKKSSKSSPSLKLNKSASTDRTVSERPGYEGEPGCADWYEFDYEIFCYFLGDDPIPYYCSDPVITFQTWLYTVCPDDPEEVDCEDPVNFTNPECEHEGCNDCDTGTEQEDDGCTTSKTAAATKANAMTAGNTSFANAVSSVLNSSTNNIEAAFRVDDNAGTITASTPIEEAELEASTSTNSNTIAIGHDHPEGGFPQPSPFDFYQAGLLAIQSNGKLATDYTFSPSASYAIVINNTTLMNQFLINYPMSSTLAKDQNGDYTGDFKKGKGTLGNQFQDWGQEAYDVDPRRNGTPTERVAAEIAANEYATTKLMSLAMGGATLLKRDSNGNWKALHYTKQTINGVTSYTVTPCN